VADADALPDFPAGAGPVRVVLVLDVLGRAVAVDEARHREVLAGLAAWEAQVRGKAVTGIPVTPARRKAVDRQPRLFVTKETNVLKVISGGQTGVDRAALDVALELGLPCGGWCPKGRLAEDGRIPDRYPLTEMPTANLPARTRANVAEADATLILTEGGPTGGTKLTFDLARDSGKPYLLLDLWPALDWFTAARDWLIAHVPSVLNVAGPRESRRPGIHGRAVAFLRRLLGG
jgi:hypothetical protein